MDQPPKRSQKWKRCTLPVFFLIVVPAVILLARGRDSDDVKITFAGYTNYPHGIRFIKGMTNCAAFSITFKDRRLPSTRMGIRFCFDAVSSDKVATEMPDCPISYHDHACKQIHLFVPDKAAEVKWRCALIYTRPNFREQMAESLFKRNDRFLNKLGHWISGKGTLEEMEQTNYSDWIKPKIP